MAKRKLTIGCVLVAVGSHGLGACGGSIQDGPSDSDTSGDSGAGGAADDGWGVGGFVGQATGGAFIGVPNDGFYGSGGVTGVGGFVGTAPTGGGGGFVGEMGTGGDPNLGGLGGGGPTDED